MLKVKVWCEDVNTEDEPSKSILRYFNTLKLGAQEFH